MNSRNARGNVTPANGRTERDVKSCASQLCYVNPTGAAILLTSNTDLSERS